MLNPKLLQDLNNVQTLLDNSPSQSGGPTSQRVETPEGLPTKVGWHEDTCGNPIQIAKEPKCFRTPEAKFDGKTWPYRTTWVLRRNEWTKVEDRVCWGKHENLKCLLTPMAEKAIFKFENDVKLSVPGVACFTANSKIEKQRKGVHVDNDIFTKNGRITKHTTSDTLHLSDLGSVSSTHLTLPTIYSL